jgi:hypothetical protein
MLRFNKAIEFGGSVFFGMYDMYSKIKPLLETNLQSFGKFPPIFQLPSSDMGWAE